MPKNITSEVRDIILKVKEFMDEEKRMQSPIIPLSKVYVRVAAATGQSLGVIKTNRLYLLTTYLYLYFFSHKKTLENIPSSLPTNCSRLLIYLTDLLDNFYT